MKAGHKLWIQNDAGDKVFGPGPYQLLLLVRETGSLRKSAAQLGMSYSKAYAVIRHAEQELGFALMSKKIGGAGGGGSHLTPEAEDLIEKYGRYEQMAERALDALYVEIFESK